jgi:hypothetical protein
MTELTNSELSAWESFYVIVGSGGAALVGLQFVVITLIADMRTRASADAVGGFSTPTVVHLSGALIVSSIMSAPWRSLFPVSMALAALFLRRDPHFPAFFIGGAAFALLPIGIRNAWDTVTHVVLDHRNNGDLAR